MFKRRPKPAPHVQEQVADQSNPELRDDVERQLWAITALAPSMRERYIQMYRDFKEQQ